MKTPKKPKRLCADCDHYEVCQAHSHTGVLHDLNAVRCGLYSDRTHDRNRIAVLEQVVEEGNRQIEQLERERDAAVRDMKRLVQIKRKKICLLCANRNKPICNQCEGCDVFEWRGVMEE